MVALTNSERLFVEHRRTRKHVGLYVFPAMLVLLVLVWGGLFVWWPLAVNPKAVLGAAETREIDCGTGALSTYAVSATVLVNVVFVLLSAIFVLGIAWARSERRYLRLLEKFAEEQALAPVRQ